MMINLIFKDLITELNNSIYGTRILTRNYNRFAYMDDILLISTTVTDLQALIDSAVKNTVFASISECTIVGGCPFIAPSGWKFGNINLTVSKNRDFKLRLTL